MTGKEKETKEHEATAPQGKAEPMEKSGGKGMTKGKKSGKKTEGLNILMHQVPAYLAVLLLILGLVGGYSLRLLLEPQQGLNPPLLSLAGDNQSSIPAATVTGKLIYSDQCKMCGKNNTFEMVLLSAGIPYMLDKIEGSSPEGMRLIANYNVKTAPTILIDENSVGNELMVQMKDGQKKKLRDVLRPNLVNDSYVIPEIGFDNRTHPKMYFAPVEGCEQSEGKIKVEIFSDTYDLVEIQYRPEIEAALKDFNEAIDFHYNYLGSYSQGRLYPIHGPANTTLAAEFIQCAAEQGSYLEFDRGIRGTYCNKGDIRETTDIELETCGAFNPHLDIPLSQAEIDNVIEWTALDLNKLNECRSSIQQKFAESKRRATNYGITVTPSAMVDCRYLILTPNIRNVLCEIMPEHEGCSVLG